MSKFKRVSALLFALLMLFGMCLPNGLVTTAYAADEYVMKMTWNGTQYTLMAGQSGSATGISWTVDARGNFSIVFTQSGTFTVNEGEITNGLVALIGGGAGGSSGWGVFPNGYGGNGGGGGALVTRSISINEGAAYPVTIGKGGAGGVSSAGTSMATYIGQGLGKPGGDTSFGNIVAAGGTVDGGAAGGQANWNYATGSDATNSRDGGGGGVASFFEEDDCGNFSKQGWGCFCCGTCSTGREWEGIGKDDIYYIPGWTPLYQHASDFEGIACGGGTGKDGGGKGANPGNDHCPLIAGTAGTDGTGGGGGGGAYGSRKYTTVSGSSAVGSGFASAGGAGGSGKITFTGHSEAKMGFLAMAKSSADTNFTNGNSCYSLAGAVYGVYKTEADANSNTNVVATLTTNASGVTQTVKIPEKTYYVKEITAPPGFALDTQIYTVNILDKQTTNLTVSDIPINDPIGVLVKKTDASTGTGVSSGAATLANAEFTFKFYPGQYDTVAAAEASGSPLRTWVYKTNSNGVIVAQDTSYVVSGDEFWYDSLGYITFPLGTLIIQETKAPEHYFIDNTKFIAHITEDGTDLEIATAYNAPVRPNTLVHGGISVDKRDAELADPSVPQGNASLAGAEFSIINNNDVDVTVNGHSYAKGATVATITTNDAGHAESAIDLLPLGQYILKETTPPAGYNLNTEWSFDFAITDSENHKIVSAGTMTDEVVRGTLTVQKADAQTNLTTPQGDASFEGAVFKVINVSAGKIVFNGTEYAPNEVVTTITTNANGLASVSGLPYGKYKVEEVSIPASTGYTVNTTWNSNVDISGTESFASNNCPETLSIYGGLTLQKIDIFRDEAIPEGDATLAGAVFEISNASEQPVVVNGRSYAVGSVITTITTDANGDAHLDKVLPMGTYKIKEATPSNGYLLNTSWVGTVVIRNNGEIIEVTGNDACPETPISGGVLVQKLDAPRNEAVPEGDATLAGAEYEVTNTSAEAIVYDGALYEPNTVVATITTDENGVAKIPAGLPYGTYAIKESKPSEGYLLNNTWSATIQVRTDGQIIEVNENKSCKETPIIGGISVQKVDAYRNEAIAEGNATLTGAVFEISNASTNAIVYNGTLYQPGEAITTITTDATGVATLNTGLPYGTYEVKETKPSNGYLLNEEWVGVAEIRNNGEIVKVEGEEACPEIPITGGVSVQKLDKDTGTNRGLGGMQMINAEFTIINRSAAPVVYDGKVIAPFEGEFDRYGTYTDGIVCKIFSNEDGFATSGAHDLPYGSYEIYETDHPSGYMLNEEWYQAFDVTEDGVIIAYDGDNACVEELSRIDIHFQKINAQTGETIPNVVFRVTHMESGESHYIITDPNGVYDSSYIRHTLNTNGNDAAVDADGNVDESKLNYECGTWFGGNTPVDERPNGEPMGAFVYGNYHFEELRTSANEGLVLLDFSKLLYANGADMDLGDLVDLVPEELETTLTDADSNSHFITPGETVVLYDTVTIHNCVVGRDYTIDATLMEKDTNAPLCHADGNPITSTYKFTAIGTEMTLTNKICFRFDGSLLTGSDLVAFEKLTNGHDLIYAVHEDINDEDQTVKVPEIGTTATSEEGDKFVFAGEEAVIIDTVTYKNFIPNKMVTLYTRLVNKATGEFITDAEGNIIEVTNSFKPDSEDGTYDVRITFDASELKGTSLVVYEYAYLTSTGSQIASHEDIDDEGQTVHILKIGTVASNGEGSDNKAIPAAPDTKIYDRVDYEGLLPNSIYTVSGDLHDAVSGEAIIQNGEAITESTTFTTDDTGNGSAYVVFTVDTTDMKGKSLVVFERLYEGEGTEGKKLAEDTELPNEAETVYVPEIATTATTDTGSHTSFAGEKVTIHDVVKYFNLYPGQEYKIDGKLVDKETGDTLLDPDGNPYTESKIFTPTESEGSEIITFIIDASQLAGKSVVAFETLSYKDIDGEYKFLTDHADTDDDDQTIHFPKLATNAASVDGIQTIMPDEIVTFKDVVHVFNAVIGSNYAFRGTLVDSEGRELKNLEKVETTVTAETADFDVELTFELNAKEYGLAGSTLTVFEKMFEIKADGKEVEVANHEEVQDEDQTIWFPEIKTMATGKNGEKLIEFEDFEDEVTVIDTVTYKALKPGEEHVMTGTLMNKETNEPITGEDGKPITASTTFTPEMEYGTVELEFTFKGKYVAGKTVVAYERLTSKGILIAVHEDIEDKDQTVEFNSIGMIYKYNGTTVEPISGVVINVTDETTGKSFDVTTGDDGYARFIVYTGHSYSYVEKTAPEGYELNTEKFTFTVDSEGNMSKEAKLINLWSGTVVLSKVNVLTNEPVPGAEIAVYKKEGNNYIELFRQTTDEYGRIYFYPGDMIGTFYFKEVSAPAGYYLDDDMHSFTIKPDLTVTGQTRFVNAPVGTIVLKKTSESGDYLAGAKYGVYDMNGKLLVTDTTDEYGRIYFVSPGAGSYYFMELDAPKGYLKDETKCYFAIDATGTVTGTTKLIDKADGSPATGDQLGSGMWLGGMILCSGFCAAGAAYLVRLRSKKKEEKN